MPKEVERKFLPGEIPASAEGADSVEIQQGYVAIDEDSEVRVRRAGADRVLTVKGGRGEVRDEVEIEIDKEKFRALWPLTEGRRLAKRRLVLPLGGGLEVELDLFDGDLAGLLIAEVEFESEAESDRFQPPSWLGEEITGDERYLGQSLARNGAPGAEVDRGPESSGPDRAFRLKRKEGAAKGVRRIAAGRAEKALEELHGARSEDDDAAGSIHAARKDLKKLRSVLRLVRAEIGETRFRAENSRYRDAGRQISESRDAEVKVETLASLRERFEEELPGRATDDWAGLLSEERDELDADGGLGNRIEAAIGDIEAGRDEVGDWGLQTESWPLLAPGIERAYRRGRREMRRARADRGAEDVHAWRKRVKDLWYQLRVVRGVWPGSDRRDGRPGP